MQRQTGLLRWRRTLRRTAGRRRSWMPLEYEVLCIIEHKANLHQLTLGYAFVTLLPGRVNLRGGSMLRQTSGRGLDTNEDAAGCLRPYRWTGLITLCIVLAGVTCRSAVAATLCVNPGGTSGCFSTIGAAVAAASARDNIKVGPGTYKEDVVIGKSISLIG